MVKLPNPPAGAVLAGLGPSLKLLPAGTELWRLYFQGGNHPATWDGFRFYGPVDARFDHHLSPARSQSRGVLHAATEIPTCVAEFFQPTRAINRRRNSPWLVGFRIERELGLHDISGTWPTAAGASMALNAGPRATARRWSRAIYESYPSVEGLWYCSSMHANRLAVLLYERARGCLLATPFFHRALSDALLLLPLKNAAAALGYLLV